MRITTLAVLSASALALASCGSKDPATSDTAATDANAEAPLDSVAPAPTADQAFANAAAASDAFEIASSRLALEASQSASIKKFANAMIEAHTQSSEKLKSAAASVAPAMTPDPTLNADQEAALAGLRGKTGADFDTAYAAAQADGHQKTLDALRAYSNMGQVPQLKEFATGLIPTVTAHLNMAKALKP